MGYGIRGYGLSNGHAMTLRDPKRAVRSDILATAWLLVLTLTLQVATKILPSSHQSGHSALVVLLGLRYSLPSNAPALVSLLIYHVCFVYITTER